jgi:hypothetical protein
MPETALDIRAHKHLIDYCSGYSRPRFKSEVHEWARIVGVRLPEIRMEFEDMPDRVGYVRSFPTVAFESQEEALAFKMRWL